MLIWIAAIGVLLAVATWLYWQMPRKQKAVFVVLPNISAYAEKKNTSTGNHSVSRDLWNGITKGASQLPSGEYHLPLKTTTGASEKVQIVPIDDGPDAEDTISRIVRNSDIYEPILLLAHETSTLAKEVWRKHYKEAKIPVILLGPTNPDLTLDDHLSESDVLLRLLPNDDEQISVIAQILGGLYSGDHQQDHSVLIVMDRGNKLYSEYISKKIISHRPNHVRFVGSVEVAATDCLVPELSRLQRLDPSTILFVGMSEAAQALIESLEREWSIGSNTTAESSCLMDPGPALSAWLSRVELVFTDGCASRSFHDFLLRPERQNWKAIYVVSTMPPAKGATAFNFEPTGIAAILLANYVAYDALIQGRLTASGIFDQFDKYRNGNDFPAFDQNHPAPVPVDLPEDLQRFKFNMYGDNNWKWQVYRKMQSEKVFKHITTSQFKE